MKSLLFPGRESGHYIGLAVPDALPESVWATPIIDRHEGDLLILSIALTDDSPFGFVGPSGNRYFAAWRRGWAGDFFVGVPADCPPSRTRLSRVGALPADFLTAFGGRAENCGLRFGTEG